MSNLSRVHVIGGGISGVSCAVALRRAGVYVTLHEASGILGGLCASELRSGVDVHLYGPHIFHTDDRELWEFATSISPFREFRATASIATPRGYLPMPLTPGTISALSGMDYRDAVQVCASAKDCNASPGESLAQWCARALPESVACACVEQYSEKVWGRPASALPASLFRRLPVYTSECRNYHADLYSGVPVDGWAAWFARALADVEVRMHDSVSPFQLEPPVIYTGPLDELLPEAGIAYHRTTFAVAESDTWEAPEPILHVPSPKCQAYRITNYTAISGRRRGDGKVWLGLEFPAGVATGITRSAYPQPGTARADIPRALDELRARGIFCVGRLAEYRYLGLADCIRRAIATARGLIQQALLAQVKNLK